MDNILPLFPTLLPSVPLAMRATLPAVSAIYFALTEDGAVLYIGCANQLQRRWKYTHHQLPRLQQLGCTAIAYYVCPREALDDIERA